MTFERKNIRVSLFDGVHPSAIELFRKSGFENIALFPDSLPESELKKELMLSQIVGIRSKTKFSREILQKAKNLLCIGRYGIGVNNIDLKAAGEYGIPVFNGPFSSTRSVAELVIGVIFGLLRQIPQKSREMHEGAWPKLAKDCFEIRGKTLGLVGYGNISCQVSIMAEALGMRVIFSEVQPVLALGKAEQLPFEEVLAQSDIVSLHVPGLPSTENMINKKTLSQMKKGSFLINFSRGSIVNIDDLRTSLENEHLRGAALDVFPNEPKSKTEGFSSSLQNMPNVILTPHIGGATEESQSALGKEVSEKMITSAITGNSSSALNGTFLK